MQEQAPSMLPKWVKASLYTKISGQTQNALNHKRQSGTWAEGIHWRKAPDGNVYYNWGEIDKWVENGFKQTANRH